MATPDAAPVVEEVVVASEAVEEAKKKPKKPKATKAAKAAKLPTTHPSYLLVILSLSLSPSSNSVAFFYNCTYTAHVQHMYNTCTTP